MVGKLLFVTPNHSSPLGHSTVNILTKEAELAKPCRDFFLVSEVHMVRVVGTVIVPPFEVTCQSSQNRHADYKQQAIRLLPQDDMVSPYYA
jgi:hypothetical protein